MVILLDWMSYINTKPEAVYFNCLKILDELEKVYPKGNIQLVGRGYSGAYLVSAMQMMNTHRAYVTGRKLNINGVIIRKNLVTDTTEFGSSTCMMFTRDPIVLIDDDIYSGRTVKAIHASLEFNMAGGQLINNVECVVMIAHSGVKLDENRYLLKTLFPNLKLWIR